MSTSVFRRTVFAKTVTQNTDGVVADCPLPAECRQMNYWGRLHCVTVESDPLTWEEATEYGLEAWVIPVQDPDTALDLDTLWDQFVPKDIDVGAGLFELNPTSTAGSFIDAGEVNVDRLMDMGNLRSEAQWYSRRKMLSWANSRVALTAGTPDVFPVQDEVLMRVKRNMDAEVMSWSLLAFGATQHTDNDTTRLTYASEALWMQTKYIDVILEQAWMELVGLTETGAETPWTDAALAVQDLVEPEPVFVTAGSLAEWSGKDWNVWCDSTFQLQVPGRREVGIISGAR